MTFNHSSNAVLAKARTMYGRRLTDKDYHFLTECKDVAAVAVYLKNNTHYGRYMTDSNIREVHRGQLEAILKEAYYNECCALCRYEITIGDYFYRYIIDTSEIDILMHFLTLLASNKTNEYIYTMPVFMDRHSTVDIKALANVKSYDDLLNLLKNTQYYHAFADNRPKDNAYNFAEIECEIYNDLYKSVFKTIDENTHGNEKKELNKIFHSILNAKNFDFIVRLKHFPSLSAEEIKNLLCPMGTLKENQIDSLIDAKTDKDLLKALSETSDGKEIAKLVSGENETFLRYMSKISHKTIRHSIYPSVVMISYLFLSEIELHNIFTIIEGVRYNVPSDFVKKLLIY